MASATHPWVVLWLLVAAGGCHLVLPLSAPEDAGGVDLSSEDLGVADVVYDQRAREQATDQVVTDQVVTDLTQGQDLPGPDVGCFEQQDSQRQRLVLRWSVSRTRGHRPRLRWFAGHLPGPMAVELLQRFAAGRGV